VLCAWRSLLGGAECGLLDLSGHAANNKGEAMSKHGSLLEKEQIKCECGTPTYDKRGVCVACRIKHLATLDEGAADAIRMDSEYKYPTNNDNA